MMLHSISCEYPEGCSCGATRWNDLISERNRLRDIVDKIPMSCNFGGSGQAYSILTDLVLAKRRLEK